MITAAAVMLFSGYADYSQSARQPEKNVVWTNEGCAFEVSFPEQPKLVTKEVPPYGEITSAQLGIGNSAFQAECFTATPETMKALEGSNREKVKKLLEVNLTESGIYPFEIELREQGNFVIALGQGQKQVEGQLVTYTKSFSIENRSVFSTTIGAPAAEFPPEGHMKFLKSIKLKSRD